jgi:hypothetical protein
MTTTESLTPASSDTSGFVPLDPSRQAPPHWTQERAPRERRKRISVLLLVLAALVIGVVVGQLLPQVL